MTGRDPHVVILSANHLCYNPRVVKEASALVKDGINVTILGMWFDKKMKVHDQEILKAAPFRFTPVLDLTDSNHKIKIKRFNCRIRSKFGALVYRYYGLANRWQLGYGVDALGLEAAALKADLYIAHSETGMQVAVDLLRKGRRVGVDMEDWFSEDLMPSSRKNRPISLLKSLETVLLKLGVHTTSPSKAMSKALANTYACAPPCVVYNAFLWSDRFTMDGKGKDRLNHALPSIHWYSQSIGQGRGLEDLFEALQYLNRPVEVHLRGQPVSGFDNWFAEQVPKAWRERVFVHPLISNEELLSRIAEHDIGFAGEMKYSRSRDLTVTNKILHYLLGGLAVVASNTAGQTEIAEQAPDAVLMYSSGEPQSLAARLNKLLGESERLHKAKNAALKAAEQRFCWERQEKVLLDSVHAALARPAA